MLIIAHRGNTDGSVPALENKPDYIRGALQAGYDVEIDVWYNKKFELLSLGHEAPLCVISKDFLLTEGLWCHAKNLEALELLNEMDIKHFFAHDRDSFVLTSSQFIWTFPGEQVSKKSIVVFPEKLQPKMYENCYGICTDYAEQY